MLQYVIALFTILLFIVLFFRKPKIETYVLYVLITLPFLDTKILPLAFGFVRSFDVITLIALAFLLKEFFLFDYKIKYKVYLILGILILLFSLLSGLNSEFGFSTYYAYYPLFTIFIFIRFLFLYSNKVNGSNWKILKALKTGYLIALIFMTVQIVVGPNFSLYSGLGLNVLNEETGIIRYSGVFAESQFNGQFLAMGCFIFLIIPTSISKSKQLLNYFGFTLSMFYLLLAGSRSAMGGFLIGLILLFIFSDLRIKIYGVLLGVFALISFFIVAPDNGIFSRADNLGDDLDFRQSIWEESYDIFQEYPILGVGLGNFQDFTLKYKQDLYLEISPGEFLYFTQPENGYLKILTEQGSVVFLVFSLFFLIPFLQFAYNVFWIKANPTAKYLIAALLCWLTAFNTVYSLSDYRLLLVVSTILFYLTVFVSSNTKSTSQLSRNAAI
mgnify:CR=1 FL=1